MTLLEIVSLGLIQGLTEFLPVSSSGHLLAVRLFFNVSDVDGTVVDAFLHLGTLAAVLAYYRNIWWKLVTRNRELFLKIGVATVPAGIAGWMLEEVVGDWLRGSQTLALALLFTAIVLWWSDGKEEREDSIEDVSWKSAIVVGLVQTVALVPGVSRSGVTIAAGRAMGMARRTAVTFSFLLSAPIIAGASLSALFKLMNGAEALNYALAVGLLAAFVSGYVAIYWLMKYVERVSFRPFAYYLIILAVLVFFWA